MLERHDSAIPFHFGPFEALAQTESTDRGSVHRHEVLSLRSWRPSFYILGKYSILVSGIKLVGILRHSFRDHHH